MFFKQHSQVITFSSSFNLREETISPKPIKNLSSQLHLLITVFMLIFKSKLTVNKSFARQYHNV